MNKKLNWFNEADISFLSNFTSDYFLKTIYAPTEDSFIYKHNENILKDGYYQLFETDFQLFSKYAKYFGFEPIRED
jgi:hypothetical protein